MAKTIPSVSDLFEALDDAMFQVREAFEYLNEFDTDDDFRMWADKLNDMHKEMEKRYDQLERDQYAEDQEHMYEMAREYYRGLM